MSALTIGVLLVCFIGGAVGKGCLHSLQCAQDTCCRSSSGAVLSSDQEGHFGPFGPLVDNSQSGGSCTPGKAQQGENCDSHCKCDTGLECYRPISGACCPPHRCYDAVWVQQQRDYWANCHPPTCYFPA
ncbi:uncharacterized protein LOC135477424 [Liolophura sinensis]|uniref:uncharacterized protein LOC135477424 n=1 Tax=Liolophura sinensis TaxID=3198878 RepID=UPI0031581B9D